MSLSRYRLGLSDLSLSGLQVSFCLRYRFGKYKNWSHNIYCRPKIGGL